MSKIPVKRILLAAAVASSLAAVVAPQAASAAEVWCRGGSSCETPYLQARTLFFSMSVRSVSGHDRVFARFEMFRDAGNGNVGRIRAGYFSGSVSGRISGGPLSRYKLRMSTSRGARVEGRLWTP